MHDLLIRETLRQTRSDCPAPNADFEERLFARLKRRKKKRAIMRQVILWPSAAATIIVGALLLNDGNNEVAPPLPLNLGTELIAETESREVAEEQSSKVAEEIPPAPLKGGAKRRVRKHVARAVQQTADVSSESVAEEVPSYALSRHLHDIRAQIREDVPTYRHALANLNMD